MTLSKKLVVCGLALMLAVGAGKARADFIVSNPTSISIPSLGTASPYGSAIAVSGVVGPIQNITVSLFGFSHTYPDDVGAVIVAPSGASVLLFSGAGDGTRANGLNFTFDDNAPAGLPLTGALASGTYRPGSEEWDEFFPAPGPGGKANDASPAPWSYQFNPLFGQDPNGTWNLYVIDSNSGDAGSIAGGWSVGFQVVPEPTSVSLLSLTLGGLVWPRRRYRS